MRKFHLIILVAFLISLLVFWNFPSVYYNNVGHLVWSRADDQQQSTAAAALPYFDRAIGSNPGYTQARIGAAILNILIGNEEAAFAHWDAGEIDSSILIAYGDKEQNTGDLNRALWLFRDSARLTKKGSGEGHILAGNVCQRTHDRPELLSNENQVFCRSYFSDNADNLFVNADFSSGELSGWAGRYWSGFSGSYLVKNESADKSSVAVIHGENNKEVGAISQHLTFSADTNIRFSAQIKTELQSDASVRLLHVVWTRPDGKPGGNQLDTIDVDMEWAYVERTLRLPQAEGSSFTFSPAILTGKGEVWIDDVRLEIVSEN